MKTMNLTKKKLALVIGGAAVATAVVGGGAFAIANDDDDDRPIPAADLEKAEDAALAETGGGKVTDTEVDDEQSRYEVEVTLDDGSQVDVQLDGDFQVVSTETDGPEDDRNDDDRDDVDDVDDPNDRDDIDDRNDRDDRDDRYDD